ncbi:hypothetical protein IWW36_000799 [Coemansia brasiliensis]|uniref:Uncharacterized protein n=1 Tax=Coemansia brasiliensis TaxID=2650707 RepID=A0A9W8M1G8_9FUNG|nr:hypothetical protein IWW36_000799 [Coemansia brasiliensis]
MTSIHNNSSSGLQKTLQLNNILDELKIHKDIADSLSKKVDDGLPGFNQLAPDNDPSKKKHREELLGFDKELKKCLSDVNELYQKARTLVDELDPTQRESEEVKKRLEECKSCRDNIEDTAEQIELNLKMFDVYPEGWTEFLRS